MNDSTDVPGSTDELVLRFLSGALSADEERAALRRIAEDPDGRRLLKLELGLKRVLSFEEGACVPEGFAERTMAVIAEADGATADSTWERIVRALAAWWAWSTDPQPVRVRPAYGLAAALILAAGVGLLGRGPGGSESTTVPAGSTASAPEAGPSEALPRGPVHATSAGETPGLVSTRFVYVDEDASSVAVAGDFNGWTPQPMRARTVNGNRVWTTTLPLREGEHQYMFVVDGEKWVTDPLAPVQREDGFGHRNAVIAL